MGIFDGLPTDVADKPYLKEDLSKVDESWAAARFDSLPHVVHILTSKDRESEVQYLKEQSEIVEDVVDEVVHAYHTGFNRAIQNYSQILRLFTESSESIAALKVDLAVTKKKLLGSCNKQLHQLWYRSVTLRHIISLLDQIEGIAKVPSRIEKLIVEKQFYAAVQLHLQSALMLEREGLQAVGALQDVRSELSKLRGVLFYKVLEDLHSHLYDKGEYSSSFDGHDGESALEMHDRAPIDGYVSSVSATADDGTLEDLKFGSHQVMPWLANSTPDEFVEATKKSDAPVYVKYLQTMVECICMLGKVAASGAMICQRLRPTIHEIITSKIKAHAAAVNSSRPCTVQAPTSATSGVHYWNGQLGSYRLLKRKPQDEVMLAGTLVAVSPVSSLLAPKGAAHAAVKELLDSILDTVIRILENHVIVGELLESRSAQQSDMSTPRLMNGDINYNPDPEASQATGGYSIGFAFTVIQSECQQLICEILRATPDAASADAAASKVSSKEKRHDNSEDGFTFAFRFTDATISISNEGVGRIRQGWNKRGPNVLQEGYGTAAVLPEQGIYLAASVYRPVLQFTDKIASLLPSKYSQLGNDGLLAFVENFLKDHFLPTMYVDYRKGVQQAISSPAAFRPRVHSASTYTPQIERGRPVLQGLLAVDSLAKEVLCWTQAMPKFSGDLVKYVQTFLERTYERCRASYMEAVLEKQSYMLIGRHDVESLMQHDPASVLLPNSSDQQLMENDTSDAEALAVEMEISDVLLSLRPIKQENLIHDDNKIVLLASLSDSLEYVADSIERIIQTSISPSTQVEENDTDKGHHHKHNNSAISRDLASFADEYRKLAIDCLKVLRVEMQLETIFHMQEMTNREYLEDLDAEDPDDFITSLAAQITRRDEEIAPFVAEVKRNYIFGGICGSAANASIKALADMKSINLFGSQQVCRNSVALEQALADIPSTHSESIQLRFDRVRTYYELLNMPFEALLAFIAEHEHLFTIAEYLNLIKVKVLGKEMPPDAEEQLSEILSR